MPRSLADLKAKPKQLPTRTVRICLDQEALADVQRLDAERDDLQTERVRLTSGQGVDGAPPKRGIPPRVTEIDARLGEIEAEIGGYFERMRDSEGDLLLRAAPGGEWQRFKDASPAREGSKTDDEITYAICDSSALLADLGRYVVSWNGETFEPGAWDEWFAAQVAPADLSELCREVVQLHEVRVRVPKAPLTDSSAAPTSGSA